jgi:Uma2 family endonuclease
MSSCVISEAEYLGSSYWPDHKYMDGALIERTAGTVRHSQTQVLLIIGYFGRLRKAWGFRVYPAVHVRLRRGCYLIADLAIVSGSKSEGDVLTLPPLIWIEILSPEDRPLRINRKVRDVLEFGVPYVWVIDPETLESELHTQSGSETLIDGVLRIPEPPIEVPLRGLEED